MPKTKTKSSDLVQTSLPREARVKHDIHFPMHENVKKLSLINRNIICMK